MANVKKKLSPKARSSKKKGRSVRLSKRRSISTEMLSVSDLPPRFAEIVASMLDPDQFNRVNGSGWVLADGRAVPNTPYADLISSSVPDLRGVYLRGRNYSRSTATGNAAGDVPVGTFQAFELVRHSHSFTVKAPTGTPGRGYFWSTTNRKKTWAPYQTAEYGGDEVRPNSVTVNFYIRVAGYPL